jgi:hypothetical protein
LTDIEEAWQFLQEAFGNSYTNLNYRLSRIGQTPGLTDRLVETDPSYAATWFLDYGNAVKEVLNLGDQGPELEALAFSAPALYTITSRLPPTMISEIRGTKRHGKLMLGTISAAISKARIEALAGSMILSNYENVKKAATTHEDTLVSTEHSTPRELFPNGISRTHPDCRICKHPETTDNRRAKVIKHRDMCLQCLNPRSRLWHDIAQRGPINHPPKRGHPPAPSLHRANDVPTDDGLKRPVMLPRLEDPATVNVFTAVAGFTRGLLDYRNTHGHLPLAIRNTALGEDTSAGLN